MSNSKKVIIIGMSVIALQIISTLTTANANESLLAASNDSLMATLDTDLDGLISLKEAADNAELLEKFNEIDVNEDGYISMDELISSEMKDD